MGGKDQVIEKEEGRFIIMVGKEKCEWWQWGEGTISFQTVLSKNFLFNFHVNSFFISFLQFSSVIF